MIKLGYGTSAINFTNLCMYMRLELTLEIGSEIGSSLCFCPSYFSCNHTIVYNTGVISVQQKKYSNFTRSELFTLIRDQKATLLNMITGRTHPSEEKIKETQGDLDNMVTALNSASIMTQSIAQKSAHNYKLAMRQQSLRDSIKKKKHSTLERRL